MRIDPKPTIPEVLPIAQAYYVKHPIGGNLHIVLDDANFGDADVIFCASAAAEGGDKEGLRLARLLLQMSRTQRRRLRALLHAPSRLGLTVSTSVS